MPPPRKVDLLPKEFRVWLQDEIKERGYAGYEDLAESLNFRLEEEGFELRLSRSTLQAFGQEFKEYAAYQEQAQDEMRAFLEEASMKDEADLTKALFQQLVTIQWKLQLSMASPGATTDPRGMKDLTTALNNLIRSTSLRDAILKADRAEQSVKLDKAVEAGDIDKEAAAKAREIMGFG